MTIYGAMTREDKDGGGLFFQQLYTANGDLQGSFPFTASFPVIDSSLEGS